MGNVMNFLAPFTKVVIYLLPFLAYPALLVLVKDILQILVFNLIITFFLSIVLLIFLVIYMVYAVIFPYLCKHLGVQHSQ